MICVVPSRQCGEVPPLGAGDRVKRVRILAIQGDVPLRAAFEKCMEPLKINKMRNTFKISSKMHKMRIFLEDSEPFPSFSIGNGEFVA